MDAQTVSRANAKRRQPAVQNVMAISTAKMQKTVVPFAILQLFVVKDQKPVTQVVQPVKTVPVPKVVVQRV